MSSPFSLEREVHHDEHGYSRGVAVRDQHLGETRPAPERHHEGPHEQYERPDACDRRAGFKCDTAQDSTPHHQNQSKTPESESPAQAPWARSCSRKFEREVNSEENWEPRNSDDGASATRLLPEKR